MLKLIIPGVILCCLSIGIHPAYALSPEVPLKDRSIPDIVAHFANQYEVSAIDMLRTMKCESSLRPNAVGDNGKSFGIAQIHLPSHPDVSKEEAMDPVFAAEFMAKEFSKGNQRIWTCARKLKIT